MQGKTATVLDRDWDKVSNKMKVVMDHDQSIKSYKADEVEKLQHDWKDGDRFCVVKAGHQYGQCGTIIDCRWEDVSGRLIKVRMDDGSVKSYLPTQMKRIQMNGNSTPTTDNQTAKVVPVAE